MIKIQTITDLKEAEKLWRSLSPNQTIFDEWDFRYCFYKYNPNPLRFLAAYEGDGKDQKAIGLLPLARHPEYGLEFLAEDPCEENRPFISPGREDVIPALYGAIDDKAQLFDISGTDNFTGKMVLEDYKYVLPLGELSSFRSFLDSRLSPKRRKSLVKELTESEKYGIVPISVPPSERLEYLESLFRFNTANFAADSYLLADEQAPWRDLMRLPFDWHLIALEIDGECRGVSLSVLHAGTWHYLITGVDFKRFRGLGKYLVKENIEAAIKAGAQIFDAGLGDCGWKNLWHLDQIPQYEFKKFVD